MAYTIEQLEAVVMDLTVANYNLRLELAKSKEGISHWVQRSMDLEYELNKAKEAADDKLVCADC